MIKAVVFDFYGVLNSTYLQPNPKMLKFAKALRDKGYKTSILSNMIFPITWLNRNFVDFKGFDPVIISSEVGHSKPDLEIYKILLNRINLEPNEIIFIDNKPSNLVPAAKLGINVIHARHPDQIIKDTMAMLPKV